MAQSPPKGSASSRPPPAPSVDGGRLITAGAAGVSVLMLSVTAVVLWPRTYGAEATLVLDESAQVENPIAFAGRIEAALLEREVLASAAMDLPPELRSPDPIGRLRAGIRVQSRGARGYGVEFRGSDPQSVQRIANRLADRAVALVPKLATSPDDAAPMIELSAKTRAVTEFLSAHPEAMTEQAGDKSGRPPSDDGALELLRTEKRQLEQRLATGATDNPYAEASDDAAQLMRRLVELKTTIQRREAALKQPKPATPAPAAAELTAQWRTLLAQLAEAQAKANSPTKKPLVSARVTTRASLPKAPLTPNRLVLSIVAVLLSLAAAMVAFVLPRKGVPQRQPRHSPASAKRRSEPPVAGGSEPPKAPSDAPPAPGTAIVRSEPPLQRSDPPAAGRPASEPPGPIGPMRPVVVSSVSGAKPEVHVEAKPRRRTSPGGLEAPSDEQASALAANVAGSAQGAASTRHSPPAAPLFGSRPPPGAGSYSVSSSHPPPSQGVGAASRTTVERLSPLQSQRPPSQGGAPQPAVHQSSPPVATVPPAAPPRIMSRPPALDPEAERWAARFETPPPPPPEEPVAEEAAPKRGAAGRWKTQVMGSMVPLEVQAAREERRPLSEPPATAYDAQVVPVQQAPTPAASTLVHHDVAPGWRPNADPNHPHIVALRDSILKQGLSRHLRVVVTNAPGAAGKAQVAGGLALSLAQAGARVLLVEADFDDPQVHQAMAVSAPSGAGFSQQIIARRHDRQARPWVVVRCSSTLQILAEGRMRTPGLLASDEFERAIRELGEQHHVLVMHAPSLDRPTDLQVIDALAQAAVLLTVKEAPTIQFGNNPLRVLL
jgi:Mrp family chromosome partitioning ATPase